MHSTTPISIEARTRAALEFKIAAQRANGWVEDGVQLVVTDYTKRRPAKRFVQVMLPVPEVGLRWVALH